MSSPPEGLCVDYVRKSTLQKWAGGTLQKWALQKWVPSTHVVREAHIQHLHDVDGADQCQEASDNLWRPEMFLLEIIQAASATSSTPWKVLTALRSLRLCRNLFHVLQLVLLFLFFFCCSRWFIVDVIFQFWRGEAFSKEPNLVFCTYLYLYMIYNCNHMKYVWAFSPEIYHQIRSLISSWLQSLLASNLATWFCAMHDMCTRRQVQYSGF